jgi:uncharacterized repeat protein (TIGR01451 family)
MGEGGSGGAVSSLSVELKASETQLDPGEVTELSWTVANATACAASNGWSGEKSAAGDAQTVPVFRDSTYTLTCEDGAGDEASSSVTVVVSGRLMATVAVSPNPAKGGERALATVVVSNPSDTPVDNVEVELDIPDYVDPLDAEDYSPGGTCPAPCGPGNTITWVLGTLQVGEVVTLVVFPTIAANIPLGTTLAFDLTVSAPAEPVVQKSATTQEGERSLAVSLEQSANKAQPGDEVSYDLHYSNPTDQVLQNVVLILALPPGTEMIVASSGATMMADGTVQWTFAQLEPGEGGTVSSTVAVDPALPEGAQLGTKAEGEVDGTSRTLATTHTALSEQSPDASVQVTPEQVSAGEQMTVAVTTSNRTLATMEAVEVSVLIPEGIDEVFDSELSAGGSCTGGSCTPGELATWVLGDLGAGESVTVSLVPVVALTIADGSFLTFDTLVSVGGELALHTSGTAMEGDRTLELRLSESDNPIEPGESLTYTLHAANQDSTAANGTVSMRVPSGTSFLRASDGGAVDGDGLVSWALTDLLPGTGTTRLLDVQVDPALPLGSQVSADATAVVTGSTREARASRTTPVSATALKAAVDVTPDPSKSAERMSVAVTVSNPGTEPADGVVIDLRIPQHLDEIDDSALSGGGTCPDGSCTSGETATWTIGSLPPGASETLTLPPVVASDTADGTLLSFDAEVRATDEVPALASATTVVDDGRPLELQLSQSENPVLPGTTLVYTLYFGNQSGVTLAGTLTLTVPDGTSFVSASDDGVFDAQKSLVTWDLTDLGSGEGGTRELAVAVDDDLELGSQLRVMATADVGTSDSDRALATSHIPVSQASLLASVDVAPDPIAVSQAGLVSVLVSNPTAQPVDGVVVDVRIPKHLEAVEDGQLSSGGACPGGTCIEGDRASWTVGTLEAGESKMMSLPPVVASGTSDGSLIPFEAEVTATSEVPVLASATTVVDGQKPLSLVVEDGGYPVEPGATLIYVVYYGNLSATPVDGAVILTIPEGTTFESASDGGGLNADGDAEWPIVQLDPGVTESRELAVTVDDMLAEGSQLRTLATATVGDTDGERVRASEHTPVGTSPLTIAMQASPGSVEVGSPVRVTATLTNTSGAPVNGVDVFIAMPQGVNAVADADLSAGGSCPGGGCAALERATWDLGSLPAGNSTQVSFTATVANATSAGTLLSFVAETTVADEPVAGASVTASVCSGATCPPSPLFVSVSGYVNDSITLGAGKLNETTITSVAGTDHGSTSGHSYWIAMYNSAFELSWVASASAGNAEGTGFARFLAGDRDDAGNNYIAMQTDVFPGTLVLRSADDSTVEHTPTVDSGGRHYGVAKIDRDGIWQWYAPIEAEAGGTGSAYIKPASTSVYNGRVYVTAEHGITDAGRTLRISSQTGVAFTPEGVQVHPAIILDAATGAYIDHRVNNSTTPAALAVMRHNQWIPIAPGMVQESFTIPTVGSVGPSGWYDGSTGFYSRAMDIAVNANDGQILLAGAVQAGVLVRRDLDGNADWAYVVAQGGGNTSFQQGSTIGAALETGDGVIFLGGVDQLMPEFNSAGGVVTWSASTSISGKNQYLARYAEDGTIVWLTHVNAGSAAGHGLTAGRPENRSALYDPVADRVYVAYAMPPWPDMGTIDGQGTFFKDYNDPLLFGAGEATEETFAHIGDDGVIVLAAFDGLDGSFLWATSHRRTDTQIFQTGPAGIVLNEDGELVMFLLSRPGRTTYGDNKTPLVVDYSVESMVAVRHSVADGSVLGAVTLENLSSASGSQTFLEGAFAR